MKHIHGMALSLLAVASLAACNKAPELTGENEINLAGCAVPAGIERSKAEAIECDAAPNAAAQVAAEQASAEPQSVEAPAATQSSADPAADASAVEAAIAAEIATTDGAAEYREERRQFEGDLTGDAASDVVVIYTLEGDGGGNSSATYMTALVRDAGQLRSTATKVVAGIGEGLKDAKLSDGIMQLTLLKEGPDDARCCPSLEVQEQYLLRNGKWLQVQE